VAVVGFGCAGSGLRSSTTTCASTSSSGVGVYIARDAADFGATRVYIAHFTRYLPWVGLTVTCEVAGATTPALDPAPDVPVSGQWR
jgi:hypothetical protein